MKKGPASPLLISLVIVLLTLVVYIQVLDHYFLNMDDAWQVVFNPHISAGMTWESIQWAFTDDLTQKSASGYWQPVTALSRLIDVEFYGFNPAGHHFTNLVLHSTNAVLLFLLLLTLTGESGPSGFVAAIFAVHPIHVESVAWISERKDVLCLFWGLLAMHAYVRFWKGDPAHRIRALLSSMIAFALGLMSKPMLVTLPFLLLLLSWWPLKILQHAPPDDPVHDHRTGKPAAISWKKLFQVLRVLVPFAALSVSSAVVTFLSISIQLSSAADLSFVFPNIIVSYGAYLWRAFWPLQLSCFYPFPLFPYPAYETASIFCLLLIISFCALLVMRNRPYLVVGWFWYLVALLPVFFQTSAATANHFAYIPLIGIYIAIAWTGQDLMRHFAPLRKPLSIAAVATLLLLTGIAWQETSYWKNSVVLFQRGLEVNPDNYVVHRNLAMALYKNGQSEKSIEHLNTALRINPNYASAYYHLGVIYQSEGQIDSAVLQYEHALRLDPDNAAARGSLATISNVISSR